VSAHSPSDVPNSPSGSPGSRCSARPPEAGAATRTRAAASASRPARRGILLRLRPRGRERSDVAGSLQYCVLALLADEERYGFDLVRALAEVDGMVTSEGTIYPLLSRLRRDGLLESSWQESPTGPPRKYYRLTDSGREALEGFVREWSRFHQAVDHFMDKGGNDGHGNS
jgi:PadR family transcriptional regulator PadR